MIYDYIANNQKKIKREGEIPDLRRRNVMKLALNAILTNNTPNMWPISPSNLRSNGGVSSI